MAETFDYEGRPVKHGRVQGERHPRVLGPSLPAAYTLVQYQWHLCGCATDWHNPRRPHHHGP